MSEPLLDCLLKTKIGFCLTMLVNISQSEIFVDVGMLIGSCHQPIYKTSYQINFSGLQLTRSLKVIYGDGCMKSAKPYKKKQSKQ